MTNMVNADLYREYKRFRYDRGYPPRKALGFARGTLTRKEFKVARGLRAARREINDLLRVYVSPTKIAYLPPMTESEARRLIAMLKPMFLLSEYQGEKENEKALDTKSNR